MKKLFSSNKKFFLLIILIIITASANAYLIIKLIQSNRPAPEVNTVSLALVPMSTIDPKIKNFGLKIKKLDILVPVVKNVSGKDKAAYNDALKDGVAHFEGTSLPGGKENIFIFGHSSAEIKSDYDKVFAKLNDLEKNDEIIILYEGKQYKYKIKNKDIVEATDISVLEKGKKEVLTLMTCWPIGTKDKRLIIRAEPD